MKLAFTADELAAYFNGKNRHCFYEDSVELLEELSIHADGKYSEKLINERRPSEIEKVQEYREKIFQSITYPVISRVLTCLRKIRRSPDWNISFEEEKFSKKIPFDLNPKEYLTENYPVFGSLENWLFELCLPKYIVDSNAVVAIIPNPETKESLLQPNTLIFHSPYVIDFKENDYAVLKMEDQVTDEKGDTFDAYYIITTEDIAYYLSGKDGFKLSWSYNHKIGELPAFKVKGLVKDYRGGQILYKTKIDAMRPRLNEAIREYSDLQAEIVQNIFTERWEYNDRECSECKGEGKVKVPGFSKHMQECHSCKGTGVLPRGPYSMITIKAPMPGEEWGPTPPAGIIEKSTDIAELQDKRVESHIYHALAAINLEFLAESPMNQSGIAKEYDREEINNFVHSIAVDLVYIYLNSAYFIGEYMYRDLVSVKKDRFAHLPLLKVPEVFDLLSASHYELELTNAKKEKMNPAIVIEKERQYIKKRFNGDDRTRRRLTAILDLDPLAGVSEEDKIFRLEMGGVSREDYAISSNIVRLVQMSERKIGDKFYELSPDKQYAKIREYLKEILPATAPVTEDEDVV